MTLLADADEVSASRPWPRPEMSQWDTPPELATALCDLVAVRDAVVLEPSAGCGNIVTAALAAGAAHVIAVELDPARCDVLRARFPAASVTVIERSFLDLRPADLDTDVDVIVGNPPYDNGADTEHVARMLPFNVDMGLLLRTVFLHGKERRERIWSRCSLRALEPVSGRVKFGAKPGKIDVSLFFISPQPPPVHQDVVTRFR